MNELSESQTEIKVLQKESDFFLKTQLQQYFKGFKQQIDLILRNIKNLDCKDPSKMDKITLHSHTTDSIKCHLNMNFNELRNIEIHFKPSIKHNNYIYKSKEESGWNLYQISNAWDILEAIKRDLENINCKQLDQSIFEVDRIFDQVNAARNILLFPKKRHITELQSQKNMKIFPLVPSDLVFSFYIQGSKLVLAIYTIKGNDSTKHILDCSSVQNLNNVMILLTNMLQRLQELKDKLILFDQIQ